MTIDTKAIRKRIAQVQVTYNYVTPDGDVLDLCDEIDRLREQAEMPAEKEKKI